uniref:Uncharacterized protein n=1 Tax=Hanusia phi TaxID=3032 RepID=A0A7S0HJP7_9CRYP|mmetsp:Transcript_24608/g.55588  ORF Transcript_24608/g.55588 Transcript_24608/m.55588 type:complete len:129 (+) Transcript_24608:69-455(+)|eukprot:748232-Hanusia_phi.AAC.2
MQTDAYTNLHQICENTETEHETSHRNCDLKRLERTSGCKVAEIDKMPERRSCKHGTCAIVGYCIREEKSMLSMRRLSAPCFPERISAVETKTGCSDTCTPAVELFNVHDNTDIAECQVSVNRSRLPSI